jgi:hypothetical protein
LLNLLAGDKVGKAKEILQVVVADIRLEEKYTTE